MRELGFMTSTRIVFDPVGWHRSATLFNEDFVNQAFRNEIPKYNISDRPLRKLDTEPIHIIPPTEPPQKNRRSIIASVLSPLLMTGAMLVARAFSYSGTGVHSSGLMFSMGSMAVVSVVIALLNIYFQSKEYKAALSDWRTHYESYIRNLFSEIKSKQKWDITQLIRMYPSAIDPDKQQNGLVDKTLHISSEIFSRGREHPDFLSVRVGLSEEAIKPNPPETHIKPASQLVPSVFKIIGEKQDAVFTAARYERINNVDGKPFHILLPEDASYYADGTGYLIDLPAAIAQRYAFLQNAPVLLKLKESGSVGIVIQNEHILQSFLSNLVLDLCFYHSPDDLQCVMLCKEQTDWKEQQHIVRRYKHLPHFRELLGDLSAFAFNRKGASLIFNRLLEILSDRKTADKETKFSHILVIVQEEYELKRHPVSEYLPEKADDEQYGISFIFCKRYAEELPKYCGQVISVNPQGEWFLFPHVQTMVRPESDSTSKGRPESYDNYRYRFRHDPFPVSTNLLGKREERDSYYRAYKTLSALYYERIAQSAGVPERVDLLELFQSLNLDGKDRMTVEYVRSKLFEMVSNAWEQQMKKPSIKDTLTVPIGKKTDLPDEEMVQLDLHEKADGPHMLVAGTTGSGKTETILTYLVNLCALYRPDQVNLLLMDMKGAGFVKRIGSEADKTRLPHVVGTVTDVDGDENGTGTVYMLKRFLLSMRAEVRKRKIQLSAMGVDSINGYIEARANLDNHITKTLKLDRDKPQDRRRIGELKELPPMPHLFMVVDEFTELMRLTADNEDIDFRSEITSLARIGRSLGLHIILISQNIEGAITPDIRVNSRARLCLKVATRDASREMIGTDLAASPLMPGNGRAYLLIGTGSRFEYFQSGYSGASVLPRTDQPIMITHAELSNNYTLFYDSERAKEAKKGENSNQNLAGSTQLKVFVEEIRRCQSEKLRPVR